jgi:hypothetical protein
VSKSQKKSAGIGVNSKLFETKKIYCLEIIFWILMVGDMFMHWTILIHPRRISNKKQL